MPVASMPNATPVCHSLQEHAALGLHGILPSTSKSSLAQDKTRQEIPIPHTSRFVDREPPPPVHSPEAPSPPSKGPPPVCPPSKCLTHGLQAKFWKKDGNLYAHGADQVCL